MKLPELAARMHRVTVTAIRRCAAMVALRCESFGAGRVVRSLCEGQIALFLGECPLSTTTYVL